MPPFLLRCLLSLSALGAGVALWSSAAANAAQPCWERVISDWSAHGRITGTYPPSCYRQAMANTPTDLRIYSSIEDDLQRALGARTARRLTSSPVAATRLDVAGSSSFPLLIVLVGSLGAAVVAGSVVASVVRRRASGPRSRA